MNRGLEVADLRGLHRLCHLTDKELENINSVHLYGSGRGGVEDRSALCITHTDEVFLVGSDRLLGKKSSGKIDELSGLSVQKIVVGEEFGAALTSSSELYMWGRDLGIPAGLSRLVVEDHVDGARCPHCSRSLGIGHCNLSCCLNPDCESPDVYQNRVSTIPHPADWKGPTTTLLGYAATGTRPQITYTFFCLKCNCHREWDFTLVSNFHILCCEDCENPVREGEGIPSQTIPAPHKVQTTLEIEDIAAGRNYLLIRSTSQLIIWGDLNGNRFNHAVLSPDNVKFTKVACGSNHIAAITRKGHLYTCGVGTEGQLGYTWKENDGYIKLKQVELAEHVMDVACGKNSTLCLLRNGTQVVYGNIDKVVQSGSTSLDLIDKAIIVVPSTVDYSVGNIVFSSLRHHVQPHSKRVSVVTGDVSDTFIVLHGLPKSTTGAVYESCASPQRSDGNASDSAHRSSNSAYLYGQLLLSDLTLKLADGDFPVHRFALYASSAHFSKLFVDSDPPEVLDMSSFNASAYRGLLKYFYGVPLGPMSCEDLFDLHVLATSYKEDWISADVLSKFKTSIDTENVLVLHDRAKAANASDLLAECQAFTNDAQFKQSVLDSLTQKLDIVELLRISLSTKS